MCVCECVSWLPLLLLPWSDNVNELTITLAGDKEDRGWGWGGFYLFFKYYVVPIFCFVKMMNVHFPPVPKDPSVVTTLIPFRLLCPSATHYFISVVSACEDKAHQAPD